MSTNGQSQSNARPSRWRRIFWIVVGAVILTWFGNALFPDLAYLGKDRVAVVRIEGPILDSQQTINDLQAFSGNPRVPAIVLRIDSPGGGVAPSQEIYNAVKRLRNTYHKTVITSMGTVAASGGYYIAVASDRILANPGTLTGSIGVIMQLANFETLLKKIGVQNIVIKSGRFKDIASPFRPMTDEDRRLLQLVMDDVHQQFIEAVAEGRSLEVADVEQLADGRVFSGKQAKDLLLIDDLGDLQDAIQLAGDLTGIEGEPLIVEPAKRFSFRQLFSFFPLGQAGSLVGHTSWMPLMYLMML